MITVAIQGVRGSYSEEATLNIFGNSVEIIECLSFEETFKAVISKQTKFAVVPLKNKIVGEISESSKLLKETKLQIFDELPLEVKHVLVGTNDSKFEQINSVRSHIEALKQCKNFLTNNPQIQQNIGSDTASSIQRIIEENNPRKAAIGSKRAVEIYGGKILCEHIADDTENWTTFYLIGN